MYRVIPLPPEREAEAEATNVLSEAFYDYPVMHFTIGEAGEDYGLTTRGFERPDDAG